MTVNPRFDVCFKRVGVCLVLVLLSACGSAASAPATSKPSPTPKSVASLAADYQRTRASAVMAEAQMDNFWKGQSAANKAITAASLAPTAAAVAAAIRSDDAQLATDSWSPSQLGDVLGLVSAETRYVEDLGNADQAKLLTWMQGLFQDDTAAGTAADKVEADLRLQPQSPRFRHPRTISNSIWCL
jgi:hypothetical protein